MRGSLLVRAVVVAFIAALATAAAQKLVIGDINAAVTGGVAGALAVASTLASRGKKGSGD